MKGNMLKKLTVWILAAAMALSMTSVAAFAGEAPAAAPDGQNAAEAPAGESAEGQSEDGEAPAGESAEGQSQDGEAPAGGGGGPQMAFVSEGMTAATESIFTAGEDEEGNPTETYSLTGYNRSVTLEDGTVYYYDKDGLYIGYSIVDGVPVVADSNFDVEALEVVDGVYQLTAKDIVIGDKFTEIYLKGDASVADISGLLVFESQMEEGQSGVPYYDENGTLITANSDMSAAGAAIVVTDGGKAYIHDLDFTSNGFAHSLLVAWGDGEHSTVADIRDSSIITLGADPISQTPSGFLNGGLDFNTMICPPWVLGLFGGTRSLNILNNRATLNVINSTVGSAGWAILSSDSCDSPVFNIVDTKLIALTSSDDYGLDSIGFVDGGFDIFGYDGYDVDGEHYDYGVAYGTYAIGSSKEYLYGVDVLGTTYATISTGSDETCYFSSDGDINLVDAIDYDEETDSYAQATETLTGAGKVSRIYSVFGFMSHGAGDIGVYEGTEVNTEDAIFLYRNGDVTYTADGAVLNSANGVILQMMDNDDAQAGGPVAQELVDMAGLPTTEYQSEEGDSNGGSCVVNMNLANGEYTGNLYNATGWYHSETWGQDPDTLNLVIDSATLNGAATKANLIHAVPYFEGIEEVIESKSAVNEQYGYAPIQYNYVNADLEVVEDAADAAYVQFTYFTKLQYYLLGHVQNVATDAGKAIVDVTLQNGAVWNVTETSYINTLTVDETSTVNGVVTELENGIIMVTPADGEAVAAEEGASEEAAAPEGEAPAESAEGESEGGESAAAPGEGEAIGKQEEDLEITVNGVTGMAHYADTADGTSEQRSFEITFEGETYKGSIDKGVWVAEDEASQAVIDAYQAAHEADPSFQGAPPSAK